MSINPMNLLKLIIILMTDSHTTIKIIQLVTKHQLEKLLIMKLQMLVTQQKYYHTM